MSTRGTGRRLLVAVLLTLGAVALVFGALAPPERCPDVTVGDLRESATEVVDWFTRNQRPDGTWLYQYEAATDEAAADYNIVRHSGVALGLYMAATASVPGALDAADRGVAWSLDRLLERDDWAAVTDGGRTTTGTTALLVAGLVERRDATGDDRFDDVMQRLGRFLVAQTEPSGAVLASYDEAAGAPRPGEYSKYYTGEAYWALARLHRTFPDGGWGDVADRIGAYMAARRDDVEDYWPPLPDHWAAYGLSETVAFAERDAEHPLTADEVDYARRQAELFGTQVRWVSQRFGPWGRVVRGAHVPRGGGYGVVGEALTGLWLAADADARLADEREAIGDRARCIAGLAIDAQSSAAEAQSFAAPGRVQGAWFRDGSTRMDDQQHALAALLRTVPIVEAGNSGASSSAAASGWLWVLALAAAFNPVRAAFGVPRDRARHPSVVALAAVGGAVGAVLAIGAALLGGPLADALDVSDPALRLAAGVVAAIAGLADLIRRMPAPEPAAPGWRAAIVPVAIPCVAGPALLVLALAAGADRGWGLVGVVVAGAVGLLALVGRMLPDAGAGRRALAWAARVVAAALVVAGVLLVIDGVFAV
jgi:small neutral amino acid transporter SnatA (MarC family)